MIPGQGRSIPGILLPAWLSEKQARGITIMQVGPGSYRRWLRGIRCTLKKSIMKIGEDFEQVHESYRKFHPAFVEDW
ncbi:MAG TPA: hypothetical protein VER35_01870 [Candidatus Limnocylindrales bacterium]|nr:hypothetical protein [Candidatus Limnocylindrales bacterium]